MWELFGGRIVDHASTIGIVYGKFKLKMVNIPSRIGANTPSTTQLVSLDERFNIFQVEMEKKKDEYK